MSAFRGKADILAWRESRYLPKIAHGREPAVGATCSDVDASDSIGDCDRASVVRALMEHGIYRRPLRSAIYRANDLPGRADGFCRAHHGRHRACRERTLASCQ